MEKVNEMSNDQEVVSVSQSVHEPTTIYINAPFATTEEEVATTFILAEGEELVEIISGEQVYYLNEDGTVVLKDGDEYINVEMETVADTENTVVADTENTVVADTENTVVADTENTVVADTENTVVADTENTVVTETESTVVAETENTVFAGIEDIKCEQSESMDQSADTENSLVEQSESMDQSESENSLTQQIDSVIEYNEVTKGAENVPEDIYVIDDDDNLQERENFIHVPGTNTSISRDVSTILKHNLDCEGYDQLIPIPDVSCKTCQYCLRQFTTSNNKTKHIRRVHKIFKASIHIKCLECDAQFWTTQKLRDHLTMTHRIDMSIMELSFPSHAAFRKWKHEIERKDLSCFTLRHGSKRTAGGKKYFYICHRSGTYSSKLGNEKRKRMIKSAGTCKLGIVCTAAIYAEETGNEITVKYCPHHYGHGKETSFVQLSTEEQTAIQENISNGVPFENLLDDIRDSQSTDHFQLFLLKKRDIKFINNAFKSEEYNQGLSDAESVDRWVRLCCQMEDSPILFYRQEAGSEEEFLLIIMTEFQKQILLASEKQVVCVDSLHRRKGARFYLTCLFIMDEYDTAFPVAFCISHKVDKNIMTQFYSSIRESTGPLSCTYFMSDSEKFYYEAWLEVMEDNSFWLWSLWYVDYRIRVQLRIFKGNTAKRAEAYKTMRMLLECQNQTVFDTMYKNYIETLSADPQSKNLGTFIQQRYGTCKETWASCYRKDIKFGTIIHLEALHRTLRYCCREGRKKRLDKFIIVVMKLIRYKMLDRLNSDLDEDKVNLAVQAINMCHDIGLEIPTEHISSLSDKIWLIRSEDEEENAYVTQDFITCPEHCSLKCAECDICVHMYSCSCVHSMINANLCQHIHAVVWKFLTPHFSPPGSPGGGGGDDIMDDEEIENIQAPTFPNTIANVEKLMEFVLKRTHEVYKKIRANKCSLNKAAINAMISRLDVCYDIASGKPIPDPPSIFKNPVIVVNPYVKPPVLQNQTSQSQNIQNIQIPGTQPIAPRPVISKVPVTVTGLPGTSQATLLRPGLPQTSQQSRFTLPNQIQDMLSQNKQNSQYVLLLPNSNFIQK